MSTMLEKAIVDAKALKEAAIKNAEATLIEKYADNIRDAVASLLEQEEDLAELSPEGELDAPAPVDAIPDATPAVADGEELCACPEDQEEIEINFDELAAAVDAEEEALEASDGAGSLDDLESLGAPVDAAALEEDQQQEDTEEEYDLQEVESIIGELIDEVLSEGSDDEQQEEVNETPEASEEEEVVEEQEEAADEKEEVEEALKVDYEPQPNGTLGGRGITNNAELENERDAVLASQRDEEKEEERKALRKTIEDLKEQVEEMTNDHSKYIKVINHLKEEVEKTNLSNAKLLYTNKILNSGSLNERQTEKIVDAISNANTVEEAKVIYETLQSAVESSRSKRNPKSLSEAITKRSSPFMPRREKPAESNGEIDRWKALAGIK